MSNVLMRLLADVVSSVCNVRTVMAGEMIDLHALRAWQVVLHAQHRADYAQAQANAAQRARTGRMDQIIQQEQHILQSAPAVQPLRDQ